MPWELLSRFRRPVRGRHAPGTPPQDTSPQVQQGPSVHQLPIDRKILKDPNSFLEPETRDVTPLGLTPSTRLPSADGSSRARSRPRPTDFPSVPTSEHSELPPGSSVEIPPRTQSRLTISRISSIGAGAEWSTFGRKRECRARDVVGVSERTSPVGKAEVTPRAPSPSKDITDSPGFAFKSSRVSDPPSFTHESPSSPGSRSSRRSSDVRFNSKRLSPTDTMSSKQHTRTPQVHSSYTTPVAAHEAPSAVNLTTPVNRQRIIDSPHTFGRPTPPDNPVEYSITSPSPPPPLPPLDHPELAAVLSLRRQSASTGQPALSAIPDRSNTLPTSRHPPLRDDLFHSLSIKLGKSIRHRSSPPQAKQDVNTTVPPDRRLRARTVSAPRRRTSADWSSYQASMGVNSSAWPAEVSREILRLSLGSPGSGGIPGSSVKRKQRPRGASTDPVHRSLAGALSPSFLPFPHPSPPDSPTPLTASATLADGRELIPSRSHSLKFDLGNRRGSQRLARPSMAEVKRSSSAIEAWNGRNNEAGGAAYPALGLCDPEALRPSPHPSLALTPSHSLLSGRISPANTPMVSSTQGEPPTPTPAPRHSGDKSRGKRKAEDNLDLTPPEQKKEGQHTTFLLPAGTRTLAEIEAPKGQRVSNSSHAPSSYHRKRARLSLTSPFTTPVQSRPSSVHETPRSASRDHHFSSLSSGTGTRIAPPNTPSRAASTRSRQPPTPSTTRKHERHQSLSQVSIPISAIVSPHVPSVSRSTRFHMRDPHRPPRKPHDTPWGLRFATEDEPGSPIQAWCFFFGFLFFPFWWIAGLLLRVPRTRIAGDVGAEKGVAIDDPQIEHDGRVWRFRCRVMAVVSMFTYVPFIVLVAIFAPR